MMTMMRGDENDNYNYNINNNNDNNINNIHEEYGGKKSEKCFGN